MIPRTKENLGATHCSAFEFWARRFLVAVLGLGLGYVACRIISLLIAALR